MTRRRTETGLTRLAVLITQMDVLRRLFGTVELSMAQWSLALVPAVALFFLWELGKLIARRLAVDDLAPSAATPGSVPATVPTNVPADAPA